MVIGITQSTLVFILIVGFYCMDTLYIRKFDRVREGAGSGRSLSYTLLVISLAIILVVQPLLLPGISLVVKGGWGLTIQATGLLMVSTALGLHLWARKHLRHFYAERVEIQPNHQLVDSGPYAAIRHPVITSFFLFAAGLLLINPSISSLLVAGFTFWDFCRAARMEEELLGRTLIGYKEYMTRTHAFFPRITRLFGGKKSAH